MIRTKLNNNITGPYSIFNFVLPNFYGVRLDISTNSENFLNSIKRLLALHSNELFQSYLKFYFPKINASHNFYLPIQQKNTDSYLNHLLYLETKIRHILSGNFFILHAATVGLNNTCLFFLGGSKAGKSTLAINFKEYGWDLYSDDLSLIEKKKQRCYYFPEFIKIMYGLKSRQQRLLLRRLRRKKELLFNDIMNLSDQEFAVYREHLDKYYELPRSLNNKPEDFRFIFVNNGVVKKPDIQEIKKSEAILRFQENIYKNSYEHSKVEFLKLILKSKCYILNKGSPKETKGLILSYLDL